jgi:hypothetical protein
VKPLTKREVELVQRGLLALVERWQAHAVDLARSMFVFDGVPFTGDWDELDALCAAEKEDPLAALGNVRERIAEVMRLAERIDD